VKLLNEELPEVGRIESPEELFASLDEDGSGEIDLEEFVHAFSSGAAP
jgi:Ca2+-binding EF-hand superfamily protein